MIHGRIMRVGAFQVLSVVAAVAGGAHAHAQVMANAAGSSAQPHAGVAGTGATGSMSDDASPARVEMDRVRRLVAEGRAGDAERAADSFLDTANKGDPYYPEALLLRGNAKLLDSRETDALYDYEEIIKEHPGSEQFVPALEKEHEIALMYLAGLRRQTWFLFRIDSGVPVAAEILVRINERLPGSALAEQALLDLANYYYDERELKMAAETYSVFVTIFPRSEHRELAMSRRVYSTIGQFRGPRYNTRSIIDAQILLRQYQDEFPLQAQLSGLDDGLETRLDEGQASQLLTTAQWYLNRGDPASARFALRRLVERHPRTGSAAKAYAYLEAQGWLPRQADEASVGAPPTTPQAAEAPGTPAASEPRP
jgi:outer membrane protein assembly factor BamD (BamD/ComL family)